MGLNFFDDAIAAHLSWKRSLRDCLDSGKPPMSVDRAEYDRLCELGKWLFGEGSRFSNLVSYQRLAEQHARFHREAAKILVLIEAGNLEAAEDLVFGDGAFSESSAEVVAAIGQLRADVDTLIQGGKPAVLAEAPAPSARNQA